MPQSPDTKQHLRQIRWLVALITREVKRDERTGEAVVRGLWTLSLGEQALPFRIVDLSTLAFLGLPPTATAIRVGELGLSSEPYSQLTRLEIQTVGAVVESSDKLKRQLTTTQFDELTFLVSVALARRGLLPNPGRATS
jgi:hypothetical protein